MLKRISIILKSIINDLLDKAEKPDILITNQIRELEYQSQSMKSKLVDINHNKLRLERKKKKILDDIKGWETLAQKAIQKGNKKLAKEIAAKIIYLEEAQKDIEDTLDATIKTMRLMEQRIQKIESAIDKLTLKLELFRVKKDNIITKKKMYSLFTDNFNNDSLLKNAEEYILDLQDELKAMEEVFASDKLDEFGEEDIIVDTKVEEKLKEITKKSKKRSKKL